MQYQTIRLVLAILVRFLLAIHSAYHEAITALLTLLLDHLEERTARALPPGDFDGSQWDDASPPPLSVLGGRY